MRESGYLCLLGVVLGATDGCVYGQIRDGLGVHPREGHDCVAWVPVRPRRAVRPTHYCDEGDKVRLRVVSIAFPLRVLRLSSIHSW